MVKIKRYQINKELETEQALRDYIGKTFDSKNYGKFKVLGAYDRYKNKNNNKLRFVIEFKNTGFQTVSFANRIKSGDVRDYMAKTLSNVGYIGDFSFEDKPSKDIEFTHWEGMFDRCYNEESKYYRLNGFVKEEWHCYKDFKKSCFKIIGYEDMKNNINKTKWVIDKDFILDGNQIYSKENCCFIPNNINIFVQSREKNRNYKYEGLYVRMSKSPFTANIQFKGKSVNIPADTCPFVVHEAFWKKKLEIAHKYVEEDFPYLSEELREVIYNKVKRKEQQSLFELKRAVNDGYFEKEYGIKL